MRWYRWPKGCPRGSGPRLPVRPGSVPGGGGVPGAGPRGIGAREIGGEAEPARTGAGGPATVRSGSAGMPRCVSSALAGDPAGGGVRVVTLVASETPLPHAMQRPSTTAVSRPQFGQVTRSRSVADSGQYYHLTRFARRPRVRSGAARGGGARRGAQRSAKAPVRQVGASRHRRHHHRAGEDVGDDCRPVRRTRRGLQLVGLSNREYIKAVGPYEPRTLDRR
jgi:hypothetical protein